ncbi:MAG TPA: GTP-binding protein, partial [Sporichthya sp.]|nr:GTP-binding protein [Sporichthya sp.]
MILRRNKGKKRSDERSPDATPDVQASAERGEDVPAAGVPGARPAPAGAVPEVPAQKVAVSAAHSVVAPPATDICGQVRLVLQQAAGVYAGHAEAAERISA